MNSVLENEEGLYHPGTSVQNRSDDFSLRECGGIVSSLGIYPKVIRWPQSSRMKRDCIIPGHRSIMNLVTSIPRMKRDCIIPEIQFEMYLETLIPMNVEGLHHP